MESLYTYLRGRHHHQTERGLSMKTGIAGVALLALLTPCLPAQVTDLTKIDRTIKKEPAYQSRAPRYGLLVLGPKAETRLWLVFDSVPDPLRPGKDRDYLYVDRDGTGDLTEERVEAVVHKRKVHVSFKPYEYEETLLEFKIGDVKGPGEQVHKDVKVFVEWYRGKERPATISARSGGRLQDSSAVVLAPRPKDAPVVHIGGRLTLGLQGARLSSGESRKNSTSTWERRGLETGRSPPSESKMSPRHFTPSQKSSSQGKIRR